MLFLESDRANGCMLAFDKAADNGIGGVGQSTEPPFTPITWPVM